MEQKKALIIIDIQNDYFPGGANPLEGCLQASLMAQQVLSYAREQNLPVIHIQHISIRPDASYFLPNTFGVEIHDNVKPLASEIVLIKHFPNSFRDTKLLEYLTSMCISDLIICGMMTHMCVDSTVRAAKDYGFNCTIISDACATKTLEINGKVINWNVIHNSFLAALSYFYSSVINSNKFIESN